MAHLMAASATMLQCNNLYMRCNMVDVKDHVAVHNPRCDMFRFGTRKQGLDAG